MHVAEIISTEILYLQPKISDRGLQRKKTVKFNSENIHMSLHKSSLFSSGFFFFLLDFFFLSAPARNLMKLKCQVRVALYHVLSIKGRKAFCICC